MTKNDQKPIIKCSKEEMLATLLLVYKNQGMPEEAAIKRATETVAKYFP